ncbi:MAG: SIMPL domain-containing protein [Bacteroidales bacterium]|jgi:uncharacterized protein YggE|nr:SIMPL domain-containing protein [Bacteroidales bacterium]
MKHFLITSYLLLSIVSISYGQSKTDTLINYIEVIGTSKIEVTPDEIILEIGLQEYWIDELQENKTKISIDSITKQIEFTLDTMSLSKDIFIHSENIQFATSSSKNFRNTGKIQLQLKTFDQVHSIMRKLKSQGILYMRVVELRNKELAKHLELVKTQAMANSKIEATLLLSSTFKRLGDLISVEELYNPLEPVLSDEEKFTQRVNPASKKTVTNKKIILQYSVKTRYMLL